jgi:hypothetical protein
VAKKEKETPENRYIHESAQQGPAAAAPLVVLYNRTTNNMFLIAIQSIQAINDEEMRKGDSPCV